MTSGPADQRNDRFDAHFGGRLFWLAEQGEHLMTARELAEVLWLTNRLRAEAKSLGHAADHNQESTGQFRNAESHTLSSDSSGGASSQNSDSGHGSTSDEDTKGQSTDHSMEATSVAFAPSAALLPTRALPEMADVSALLPVWLEDPALLNLPLQVLRAMGGLLGRTGSSHRTVLDEEQTVEDYARSLWRGPQGVRGILTPVWKPVPEPRFDLVLVADGGLSMQLWDRLQRDLCRLFRSCGAFRDFRVLMLCGPDGALREKRQLEVLNPERRCVLLLLSDCVGKHWWTGDVFPVLKQWSETLPMAILQVLPRKMWERSALGLGEPLSLWNPVAAGPAARYLVRRLRRSSRRREPVFGRSGPLLPVLSCDPSSLSSWSGVVMGDPRQSIAGFYLPDRTELSVGVEESEPPVDPLEQLQRFQELASFEAQELLGLLAASPVLTLPVMRLVKEALMVSDQTPLAMAEVLLGGVMRALAGNDALKPMYGSVDQLQFEFLPGIREQLLNQVSPYDTVAVVNAVSKLVERRWNRFAPDRSFRAFLTNPSVEAPAELEGLSSFANVTASIIERLGGRYAEFAGSLRDGARKVARELWPADTFAFQEQTFETAQLLRIPEPEARRFEWARFEEIELVSIGFTTASIKPDATSPAAEAPVPAESESDTDTDAGETLEAVSRSVLEVSSWTVTPSDDSTWGYHEPLTTGPPTTTAASLALTMLQIPTGSFQMGSPATEEDRYDDEGPQHEVHLQEFFLCRTPITQAQWRVVSNWQPQEGEPVWKAELDPDPVAKLSDASQLSGDQRPVVNVSWHDAMEFCRRLRQRTGKCYTLPSEAQWEYACRAGTIKPFHFGETITPELANYDGNHTYGSGPKGEYRKQTTEVASLPANAWGLQDMHGNVWEWCEDHWHESYSVEGSKAPEDGSTWIDAAADEGKDRLLRGGSWNGFPRYCRSAARYGAHPDNRNNYLGFRVCCLPQDFLLTS